MVKTSKFQKLFGGDGDEKLVVYTDGGARGNPGPSFAFAHSLKSSGLIAYAIDWFARGKYVSPSFPLAANRNIPATGKLPFSRLLSLVQDFAL